MELIHTYIFRYGTYSYLYFQIWNLFILIVSDMELIHTYFFRYGTYSHCYFQIRNLFILIYFQIWNLFILKYFQIWNLFILKYFQIWNWCAGHVSWASASVLPMKWNDDISRQQPIAMKDIIWTASGQPLVMSDILEVSL